MKQIEIDGWSLIFQTEGHWVASQPIDIDNPDGPGYNAWMIGDSLFIDSYGLHDDPTFVEVPLTVIKKLLELK